MISVNSLQNNSPSVTERVYDIFIFCALPVEAKAVIEIFSELSNCIFEQSFSPFSKIEYRYTQIMNKDNETLSIMLSWPPNYGPEEAVLHIKTIIDEFKPRFSVMSGICAGDKSMLHLGDIVVADRSFNYSSGKCVFSDGKQYFLPDTDTRHPTPILLQYIKMFDSWKSYMKILKRPISKRQQREWILDKLYNNSTMCFDSINTDELQTYAPNWRLILNELQNGNNPIITSDRRLSNIEYVKNMLYGLDPFPFIDPDMPECVIAPIASGSAVRSDNPFADIKIPVRKTVAIDMESYAFYRTLANYPKINSLLVKAVSDYADNDKDDSYHGYSAKLSALYLLCFLQEYVSSTQLLNTDLSQTIPEKPYVLTKTITFDIDEIEDNIISSLTKARNSHDISQVNKYLNNAEQQCNRLIKQKKEIGYSLLIEVSSDQAKESRLYSKKIDFWTKCINTCHLAYNTFQISYFVDILCRKVIDFIQDVGDYIDDRYVNHLLSDAKKLLDIVINNSTGDEKASLLTRKSSLLRTMSKNQNTRVAEIQMSEKSLRCIDYAMQESNDDSWDILLQKGLALWNLSQFEKNDVEYNKIITMAENSLWKSVAIQPNTYNLFTLCNLYRKTYQSIPFIGVFDLYSIYEYDQRHFYRNSYMLAEIAIQLWYNKFPSSITDLYLDEAERILDLAIIYDCGEARHIVDLAFIKAIKGETEVSLKLISTLHNLPKNTSWLEIAQIVSNAENEDDLITRGFAMGITDSHIWNKLGTYSSKFLNDISLAILLYEQAISLNKSNAVALTNLARILLFNGSKESITNAEEMISKAASCANRHFRWWKIVREQIIIKREDYIHSPSSIEQNKLEQDHNLHKLSDLHRYYRYLKTIDDNNEKSEGLKRLVNRLIELSLYNDCYPYIYSFKLNRHYSLNLDMNNFYFNPNSYTIFTEYVNEKLRLNAIDDIIKLLLRAKLNGIIISVNGFESDLINSITKVNNPMILLMDGDELDLVLQGSPSFDEAIRIKQIALKIEQNPYYILKPSIQIEMTK